jgi:hypothetical protein
MINFLKMAASVVTGTNLVVMVPRNKNLVNKTSVAEVPQ